ncbi:SpoIIE family protein phosphatase [Actinomadura rupiterrae]|uniref:SpoIIE family protein phosphatase n=1 Tax=Actinomadura rupiterrae TaxID=559627 RepID=UPI0020A2E44C|nr:SpoIIE family protein phosphatase [Actinomadura rupiterrae]MCP2340620.1 hypothetical protein [Actinomadura rupiterrae]
MLSRSSSIALAQGSASVSAARQHLRAVLLEWGLPPAGAHEALLVADELVAGAVLRKADDLELTCRLDGPSGRLRIEVGCRTRTTPFASAHAAPERLGPRLTYTLAEQWGVTYTRETTTAWFELAVPSTEAGADDASDQIGGVGEGQGPGVRSEGERGERSEGERGERSEDERGVRSEGEPEDAADDGTRGQILEGARVLDGSLVLDGVREPFPGFPAAPMPLPWPSGLSTEAMFDQVVQWTRAITQADAAYVLVGSPGEGLRVRASTASAMAGTPESPDARVEEAARLLAEAQDDGREPPRLPDGGFLSVISVPIRRDGERLGVVVAVAVPADRFGTLDVARLRFAADALTPVVADERRAQAHRDYRTWIGFLAEAGELLAGTLDANLVVALGAQLLVPRIGAWCAVFLAGPGERGELAHVWHADEQQIGALRAALGTVEAPLGGQVKRVRPWPGLERMPVPARLAYGPEVLELPLATRDQRLGTVLLGGPEAGSFPTDLLQLSEDLCARIAGALLTARSYGEQAAASLTLQRGLLPSRLPPIPGLDYDIVYAPAGQDAAAGGDFYDVFAAAPGCWRFTLGDVCGTGPEAASVTGLARHTLRALCREGYDSAPAMERLNEAMLDEGVERLLTAVHGELRPDGEGVALSVVLAGHIPPLLLRPDGSVRAVGESQILLGAMRSPGYEAETARLAPGELLLCVTDGVTERRRDGRLLDDDDGLAALLSTCTGLTARAVTRRLHNAVRQFGKGGLDDDLAILAFRAVPTPDLKA